MSNRTFGLILVAGGALLALISLGADVLGLGAHPDFGWRQILGALVGIGLAAAGIRQLRR